MRVVVRVPLHPRERDPGTGMRDTDGSPTKSFISKLGKGDPYWEHNFGKRPMAQLFNVVQDPDCIKNLAGTENSAELEKKLHDTLMTELKRQKDPRVLGNGEVFDKYLSRKKPKRMDLMPNGLSWLAKRQLLREPAGNAEPIEGFFSSTIQGLARLAAVFVA